MASGRTGKDFLFSFCPSGVYMTEAMHGSHTCHPTQRTNTTSSVGFFGLSPFSGAEPELSRGRTEQLRSAGMCVKGQGGRCCIATCWGHQRPSARVSKPCPAG